MQSQLTRVLAATDFSPTAEAAVDQAIHVARQHGATLRLVHVLTLPAPLPDYVPAGSDFGREIHRIAAGKLDETAERARAAGVEVDLEVPIGVPSQVVVREAEDHDVGLVVIGTRGLTGLAHLLLGSTAERVVQRAPCPVLSIHPDDTARPIRTLLVPTDFSPQAEEAARVAEALLCAGGEPAKLILLHAFHLPIEYTAYGPIPTSTHYMRDAGADAEARLDEAAEKLRREGLEVEVVAQEGYAPEVIVDAAERHAVDLIAMGTHGRTGLAHLLLGSTAERVVQHAGCPVMTVRLDKKE
ncbi:MAG TPA: universal stress protein [Thermoanaerobaculia bacterium]|nr:universal stress protein [Thermoanaerobaculia bacterium]